MTNLHDARVEAAEKAMDENFNPDKYPIMAAMFRDYAEVSIAAADAVVTVEMIADALRSIPDAEPGDRRDPATVIAEYLHSALFGEVAGDE